MVLEHPATPRRLAWRVCELFLGEKALKTADVASLADGLRERKLDMGWVVETVLRSRTFFADDNLGNRVLGPVEYVVGAARALELFEPPSSTLVLAEWSGRLGQDLFYPPNVGGWPGGRSWISTRSAIGRYNYAVALLDGDGVGLPRPVDVLGLARRHDRGDNLEDIVVFFAELLLGAVPSRAWRERLLTAVDNKRIVEPASVRRLAVLMIACPEAQLA